MDRHEAILGRFWGGTGPSWTVLGQLSEGSWGVSGEVLGRLRVQMGRTWSVLSGLGAVLTRSWGISCFEDRAAENMKNNMCFFCFWRFGNVSGRFWAALEPFGPSWGGLGTVLGRFWCRAGKMKVMVLLKQDITFRIFKSSILMITTV